MQGLKVFLLTLCSLYYCYQGGLQTAVLLFELFIQEDRCQQFGLGYKVWNYFVTVLFQFCSDLSKYLLQFSEKRHDSIMELLFYLTTSSFSIFLNYLVLFCNVSSEPFKFYVYALVGKSSLNTGWTKTCWLWTLPLASLLCWSNQTRISWDRFGSSHSELSPRCS